MASVFVWGENRHGDLVHVSQVNRGLDCKCICPECKEQLVAYHGKKNDYHFRHYNRQDICEGYVETVIHRKAKKFILDSAKLFIPAFLYNVGDFSDYLFMEHEIELEDVKEEEVFNNFRPDILAIYNGQPIAIEIYVTHKLDNEKRKKIKQNKITTLEIDLSEYKYLTDLDDIDAILEREIYKNTTNKEWVYFNVLSSDKNKITEYYIKYTNFMQQKVDDCLQTIAYLENTITNLKNMDKVEIKVVKNQNNKFSDILKKDCIEIIKNKQKYDVLLNNLKMERDYYKEKYLECKKK